MSHQPYNEGYETALEDHHSTIDDNPYEEDSYAWKRWRVGFTDGLSDNRPKRKKSG